MSFDLHKPSPDAGHEGIRQAVVQAIADLGYTTENTDVSFSLLDLLFDLLGTHLAAVDDLVARLEALENPVAN